VYLEIPTPTYLFGLASGGGDVTIRAFGAAEARQQ